MSRSYRFSQAARWLALVALGAALAGTGCTSMPLNRPSALSPAQHGTAEAP